jgi:hypothetical protein
MSSPIKKPPGLGGSDFKLFALLYLSISGKKIPRSKISFIFFPHDVPFRTEARNLCRSQLETVLAKLRNLLRCFRGYLNVEQISFIFFPHDVPFRTEARNLCRSQLETVWRS